MWMLQKKIRAVSHKKRHAVRRPLGWPSRKLWLHWLLRYACNMEFLSITEPALVILCFYWLCECWHTVLLSKVNHSRCSSTILRFTVDIKLWIMTFSTVIQTTHQYIQNHPRVVDVILDVLLTVFWGFFSVFSIFLASCLALPVYPQQNLLLREKINYILFIIWF